MFFRSSLRDLAEFGDFSRLWRGEGVGRALQTVSALERKAHLQRSSSSSSSSVVVVVFSKAFLRSILHGCLRARRNLGYAMRIHSLLLRSGLLFADDCLSEELIRLFAACENGLHSANRVFATLPSSPGLCSWNAIISSHVSHGKPDLALRLYDLMARHRQIQPDKVTYAHALRACGNIRDVRKGRLIHRDLIIRHGSQASKQAKWDLGGDDAVVGGSILDMYAKCGAVEDAESMFDGLPERDVVAWGSMPRCAWGDSLAKQNAR
jgi:pentatricopeptide repeat protein